MKKELRDSRHFSNAEEQDAVPPLTLADAYEEARWDRAFAESIPQLKRLAAEAARERRLGLTEELDPSQL